MLFARWVVFGVVLACSAQKAPKRTAQHEPEVTMDELSTVAKRRIYFGHQSVGGNILDGFEALGRVHPGAGLQVRQATHPKEVSGGGIIHGLIGQNENPETKIRHFAQLMEDGGADTTQIAFFKLCYIDFDARTDAKAVFEMYRNTMARLREKYPGITFVHLTVPLTTVQTGPKAALRRLLGKAVWGEAENIRRARYNELVRSTYEGKEPLFDLAHHQSINSAGEATTFEKEGRSYAALAPEYTQDGGHLTPSASERMARHLVRFLARLPLAGSGASQASAP